MRDVYDIDAVRAPRSAASTVSRTLTGDFHPYYGSAVLTKLDAALLLHRAPLRVIEFEWDPLKARANVRKHGVSFAEAVSIFSDQLSLTIVDTSHFEGAVERRLLTLGESAAGRLIVVSHTYRDDRIRIISARRASRREIRQYESG